MSRFGWFFLTPTIIERLERSAQDKGFGGWQNLCASILECEKAPEIMAKEIRLDIRQRALRDAVEALKAYRDADSDE